MSARNAYGLLLALALLVLTSLLGLLAWQMPALVQGVWLACQDLWAALDGFWPALGLSLPLLLLLASLGHGIATATTQVRNTRRLLDHLAPRAIPLTAELTSLASDLLLEGRLFLVDDSASYAFTEGLREPRIWLSRGLVELLEPEELRAVLGHERHHVRRRDPLRIVVSRTLASALFFLPLAAALGEACRVAMEVEADVATADDRSLATALVKLLRQGNGLPNEAALAAIGPLGPTESRIHRLLAQDRQWYQSRWFVPSRQLLVSSLVAAALLVTSTASLARAATPLQGGECGYSTRMSGEQVQSLPINGADYTPAGLP